MTATLREDLQARWRPTEEQIAAAEAALAAGADVVYTAHVLIGKEYGWWTEDVEVHPVEGVFTIEGDVLDEWMLREVASIAARQKAQGIWYLTGVKTVGGYTRHTAGGQWSVWEDILSQFPVPAYSTRSES